jgi:antirestriction protein ArdC
VLPWRRSGGPLWIPFNALTQKAYNGVNVIALWVEAEARQFSHPIWATYKQWAELGAQVRKGEKAALVVFYKQYETEPDPDREDDDGKRRVAKASWVFNCAQVDGYTPPGEPERLGPIERIETVDRFLANTGARVEHGGESAFYRRSTDTIHMPDEGLFIDTATMTRSEGYYAVLAHEQIHWAGAEHRLNREFGKRFGDNQYAAEELVAEIGSAFLAAELQFTQDTRPDHAHYLAHWMRLLKDDPKAIFTAAAKASQAVNYLKSLQPQEPEPPMRPPPTASPLTHSVPAP